MHITNNFRLQGKQSKTLVGCRRLRLVFGIVDTKKRSHSSSFLFQLVNLFIFRAEHSSPPHNLTAKLGKMKHRCEGAHRHNTADRRLSEGKNQITGSKLTGNRYFFYFVFAVSLSRWFSMISFLFVFVDSWGRFGEEKQKVIHHYITHTLVVFSHAISSLSLSAYCITHIDVFFFGFPFLFVWPQKSPSFASHFPLQDAPDRIVLCVVPPV